MNENSFWIDRWGISGYTDKTTVNQQNKEFQIEISKEADRIPRIEVYTTRKDKLSHKIPQSSKYNKITRIQESEFNEYFNQTLQNLHHLDVSGGEYFISSDDYSDTYELEAFLTKAHVHLSLYICHTIDFTEIRMATARSFARRPGISRNYVSFPEPQFRQIFNLMMDFCHNRESYVRFQDPLYAQIQALVCDEKPVVGLSANAGNCFDQARSEMLKHKKNIELRLLNMDEPTQKRKELRAEIKGIDFCVSILDANR